MRVCAHISGAVFDSNNFFLSLTLHLAQSITVLKITNKKLVHVRIIFFWIFCFFFITLHKWLCFKGISLTKEVSFLLSLFQTIKHQTYENSVSIKN